MVAARKSDTAGNSVETDRPIGSDSSIVGTMTSYPSASIGIVDSARHQTNAATTKSVEKSPSGIGAERKGKHSVFRKLCQEIEFEISRISDFLVDGAVTDEGLECVVEIEALLEVLYNCPWGEGESLKKIVLALQTQLLNTTWREQHVKFLRNSIATLRISYLVNEDLVQDIFDQIEANDLDPFRGTVAESEFNKCYRLVEE